MESFTLSPHDNLTSEEISRGRDQVLEQMAWARQYTLQLIESVEPDLWYQKPEGANTNLAWQVGHLAVSQYGLMLFRQRGRSPGDLEIMPGWLRKQFGRGTTPPEVTEKSPAPEELLNRLKAIHERSLQEVADLDASVLSEPTEMPFMAFPIKLGALMFCPYHEGIHAGQIGLLRRLLGLEPLR